MNLEKYNLNWHTYSDHLREMLHEMMKSNDLTDVTLVCDDKIQFKAHKIVLSSCSSVFKSIMNDLPNNSSVIYLKGIQHQEMKSILEYMYLGVATFDQQERLNEFLDVAKNLGIKEISKNMELDDEKVFKKEPELSSIGKYTEQETELKKNTGEDREAESDICLKLKSLPKIQRKTKGMFICDKCEVNYTNKSDLIRHFNSKHEGVKYDCDQCDQQFTAQNSLEKHIKSKHEGVKYDCNQCNYQATRQHLLKYHIDSKHQGVKYHCNQCDKQFEHQSSMAKHIKSQHEGVKYDCNQCDYQTTQMQHLKIHIESKHQGAKYGCNECDQQFAYQSSLAKHIKSQHKGFRYDCNQCDYQATQQCHLTTHKKVKH